MLGAVVDEVEALYRLIYETRRQLDPTIVRNVADFVSFFAESFDGRLPPPSAIDWRRLVAYPDIDIGVLSRAAEAALSLPPPQPELPKVDGALPTPRWAAAAAIEARRKQEVTEDEAEDALNFLIQEGLI